ncbi:YDG/SRA domain-containing protein [Actinomadura rupiterrae]|uniref:YDG/SRA domain-containing protein n=1 Tax=Actinomadura rupiterrae TaxID=559627 RepID=UPI0020A2C100|nr:YDG/SRA domain-containing protein [Actinomadura rupiterrae]MCP2337583.1 putative restriction endonuclease [Actinomadura rupiterrae]
MGNYERKFGEKPEHWEGRTYGSRVEIQEAGLHAHERNGISGTAAEGADAIVVSGGYTDDEDRGDELLYTGEGGRDPNTGKQVKDQSEKSQGNAGLITSEIEGLPVRVFYGSEATSEKAPKQGYVYDGLYRVVDHWFAPSKDDPALRVLIFHLVKIGSAADVEVSEEFPSRVTESDTQADVEPGEEEIAPGPVGRTLAQTERLNRRREIVREVKAWYGGSCQVCGQTVDLPNGRPYSEGAHIKGLGKKHNGPDVPANLLCLCPNDHIRFDYGAIYLTDELQVVNKLTGEIVGDLRIHRKHKIELEYVRYHRALWAAEP